MRAGDKLALLPAIGIGIAVVVFYAVEAHLHATPWLFTDELEWTQVSRAIASTGHAARRGEPADFKSVYSYLIAPAWWFHSTATAYAAIKYLNELFMLLAAVPAYLLGRLLVPRPWAFVIGLLTVAIPSMSYATSIGPESIAYAWFAVCAWLAIRALARPTPRSVLLATASVLFAPVVRKEFVLLPIALALAAVVLWVLAAESRTRRALVAAVAVGVGAIVAYEVIFVWIRSSHIGPYIGEHTFRHGLLAFGALSVGVGLLPVIATLSSVYLPDRAGDRAYRAYVSYFAAAAATMLVYTAGKATYLGRLYEAPIEERNLFYLAPLLFVGTALAFAARRLWWPLVAAATALVVYSVWPSDLQVGVPYFEAPGLAILTLVNRDFDATVSDIRWVLLGTAAIGLLFLVNRRVPGVPAVAAVLLCAWMVTGEIEETIGNDSAANRARRALPAQPDWVDRLTDRHGTTFLGQLVGDGTTLWLTEFWNRSLDHVASVDGSAPGPGPTIGPGVVAADGTLSRWTGDHYVLAGRGVTVQGRVVGSDRALTLYRVGGPWRLRDELQQVYSDGWAPAWCAYTVFARGGPGVLVVSISRTGYRGDAPPGNVTVSVGTVRLNIHQGPAIARVTARRHTVVENGGRQVLRIPVSSTPVRVVVHVNPTFPAPAPDPRQLGAQVAFRYHPNGV